MNNPEHPCLEFWGTAAAELLALMAPHDGDPGWAAKLDQQTAYDVMVSLGMALEQALGQAHREADPWKGGTIPSADIQAKAEETAGGLQADKNAPANISPPPTAHPDGNGWLTTAQGGWSMNPAAVGDADNLYGRVRNALDGLHSTSAVFDQPVDAEKLA